MIEWGKQQVDYSTEKAMVKDLQIAGNVNYLPLCHKRELVHRYNLADAVLDNFVVGAFGTTAIEALACGRPVIGYAEPDLWLPIHGSVPPVLQARTEDEIYEQMIAVESARTRRQHGERGRRWVAETCEMKVVARQHRRIYEETLRR
jgi:glycosyltransferase involved in cell wall biosynthesis